MHDSRIHLRFFAFVFWFFCDNLKMIPTLLQGDPKETNKTHSFCACKVVLAAVSLIVHGRVYVTQDGVVACAKSRWRRKVVFVKGGSVIAEKS